MIENTKIIFDLLGKITHFTEEQIQEVFKNNIVNNKWVIVDPLLYNKYKNKITITNISYIKEETKANIIDYNIKDVMSIMESKDYYINIKYSNNFIAFSIAEREYESATNPLVLICFNRYLLKNFEDKKTEPPNLLEVLKVLGWKITAKAKNKISQDYTYF